MPAHIVGKSNVSLIFIIHSHSITVFISYSNFRLCHFTGVNASMCLSGLDCELSLLMVFKSRSGFFGQLVPSVGAILFFVSILKNIRLAYCCRLPGQVGDDVPYLKSESGYMVHLSIVASRRSTDE